MTQHGTTIPAGGPAPGRPRGLPRPGRRARLTAALVLAVLLALVAAGRAGAASVGATAPLDAPGPALSVPRAALDASLRCSPGVDSGAHEPVLLVPGTTLTPQVEFSWSYEPALRAIGRPYCSVELPDNAMGDIQVASEYVVDAIRALHRRSGRRVEIVGHSQGGMIGRWALRFWPDLRPMVDDLVGLAPSNHGTALAPAVCGLTCAPAFWQQRDTADFVAALNSRTETFAGVDYTVAYTALDEVVFPNQDARSGSSSLRTGQGRIANLQVQELCPLHVADHLTLGTSDPVGYAIVVDAISHPGPADPARIDRAVCRQGLQPGVDPTTFAADFGLLTATVAREVLQGPKVAAEPALRCYVTASCPAAAPAAASTPAAAAPRRASRVTLTVRRLAGPRLRLGARLTPGAAGRVVVRIAPRGRSGGRSVTLRVRAGRTAARAVTLPRSWATRALTVRARYAGDATHRAASATKRVAARRG
jgi:triacylglycerol esterase/lipase EstA (alpha/beta hydrolase family)